MNIERKEIKLYALSSLKKAMKENLNQETRKELDEFTTVKKIFSDLSIKNLYTNIKSPNEIYLNEKDVEVIILLSELKYNINITLNKVKHKILNNEMIHYICNSFEDFKDSLEDHKRKPEIKLILDSKKKKNNNTIAEMMNQQNYKDIKNLNIPYLSKKIISLDFEFKQHIGKIKFEDCTEFGITTLENGIIKKEHFLLTETYLNKTDRLRYLQYSFTGGQTQFMSVKKVKVFLEERLKNIDYLLFHGMSTELKILKNNNVDIDFNKVKVIDTQKMQENFEIEKEQGKTLKQLLKFHNIEHKFLHNSGNDAGYTLDLLLKMHETQKLKNKTKKILMKASCS